ncbi:Cysteine/Histidine-rich C1 domain family protein [Striga hermonthica]|uniref:Cysteine/Histidine-rich C1 domain family protein n=1 Tax=Striga hermonthica TaxID=68872 RepID=A0A9N7N773_STRHE|nr:Cysteine/Histidine-rich C1 domain family protein [Striga hermonthica]
MMQRRSSTMKRSNSTSSIEFPTLAQAAGAKQEISHYSHSKHPLTEIITPEIFRCSGCREYGAGKRFSCRHCDFQLHVFCALSPPVFNDHPLHAQHQLVFHSKPRSGLLPQTPSN